VNGFADDPITSTGPPGPLSGSGGGGGGSATSYVAKMDRFAVPTAAEVNVVGHVP
jgi:hypothetical protein